MNYELIEKIKKFVEQECRKSSSKYSSFIYEDHLVPASHNAKLLAEKTGADEEIVVIAALMHDIGSITIGRENHHITGSEIAEEKLKEFNYPQDKINLIKKCILNHRGSVNNKRESKEEQIIADVDGMSAFERIEGLFSAALVFEKMNQREARISVRRKLINSYNKLSAEAKQLVKNKYDAALLLLGGEYEYN